MKPAAFRYLAPTSLGECVDLLHRHGGDAKVLAGGQSLVPLMNLRLARPEILIDINHVSELAFVRRDDGVVEIGAMTRHVEVAEDALVLRDCPAVAAAAKLIGYPAIRNRGTIGGSIAHADPAAEMPCVAVASDAAIQVTGPAGQRSIPAGDFFRSHFTSALEPTELITSIRFPTRRSNEGWGFHEFARKTGDFAIMAVAALLVLEAGAVVGASIAVAGAGGRPLRASSAEALLIGQTLSHETIAAAAANVTATVAGLKAAGVVDDYRAHLAGALSQRALESAAESGAREGSSDAR